VSCYVTVNTSYSKITICFLDVCFFVKRIVKSRQGHQNPTGRVSLRGGEADVAISYKETESGWQITESRKCIVRNLQSAIRKPLLFQEIATSVSVKGKPLSETSSQ
jgi:hypothetical protein